jgi:hypothetical protein
MKPHARWGRRTNPPELSDGEGLSLQGKGILPAGRRTCRDSGARQLNHAARGYNTLLRRPPLTSLARPTHLRYGSARPPSSPSSLRSSGWLPLSYPYRPLPTSFSPLPLRKRDTKKSGAGRSGRHPGGTRDGEGAGTGRPGRAARARDGASWGGIGSWRPLTVLVAQTPLPPARSPNPARPTTRLRHSWPSILCGPVPAVQVPLANSCLE